MSEVRALIERLVEAGIDPVEAAEIVTRAAITGAREAGRSPGAVRQQRYRERNKASQSVTGDACDDAGSLPSKEGPHTPKETQPTLPTTPKEKTPKGVQKKAVRLPADWRLPAEWRAEAVASGLPADRADLEGEKMRDWSLSAPNGAKRDWHAAWRNWYRGAIDRLPRNKAPPSKRATEDFIDSLVNQMDQADANSTAEIEGHQAAALQLSGPQW